jgi:FkbM family methyltransferase
MNGLRNVSVLDAAVSDETGELRFAPASSNSMGRIAQNGRLVINALSLDDLMAKGIVPNPAVVKIDVEGGEGRVLAGAERLLATGTATFLIATHGADVHQECLNILKQAGYLVQVIGDHADELIATHD